MKLQIIDQAPVVQTMDSAIHRINHHPLDNSIGFACVYPVDRDLSSEYRYPLFEQLGPVQLDRMFSFSYNSLTTFLVHINMVCTGLEKLLSP